MTLPVAGADSSGPDPNGARTTLPEARTTLDLIEEQVRLEPRHTAVVYGGEALDYRAFDTASSALADRLLEQGAERCVLLPVFISDGLELPIALVAAMKAAIPFVPFDPSWPRDRVSALIEGMGTRLALVSPRTPNRVPPDLRPLEVDHKELGAVPDRVRGRRPDRDDLAYGFFTSGTTGLPKCTLNLHLGLLNRLTYMTRHFGAGHVSLQNSRSTFDSSLWQLLWPLTMGGTVVMPQRDGLLDLESTVRTIGRHGVTVTDFVPSIFTVFVDMLGADPDLRRQAGSLRHVLIGGEAINVSAVARFHDLLPHVRITNTYGPTEASIGSVFHTVEGRAHGEIPLGRPIDNTSAVVVDESFARVGTGIVGEILIGGICLGAGYLGDPERTRAAFIPNPFPDVPGQRLYRTGDLGQYRDDGLLYFAGRGDDQLKVRGVRIEPSEVEQQLGRLPGVRAAHVVTQAQDSGTTLVAAVTVRPGFDKLAAREQARGLLPAEMVPDRFIVLDAMPLSPNGKVDRRALSRLLDEADDVTSRDADTSPLEGREGELRDLWGELIAGPPARPDDDFLALGGTSLSLHQLALRIRRRYGVMVPVRAIAAAPTLRAQAALIDAALADVPASADQVQGLRVPQDGVARAAQDAEAQAAVVSAMIEDAKLPEGYGRLLALARSAAGPVASAGSAVVPVTILLTGASGFVGSHQLDELLRRTEATVVCLVRAADKRAAREHMERRARYYRLDISLGSDRVHLVPGDVGVARFGLDPERYARLAGSVDCIVHAAAEVNLLHDYLRLRTANVGGTREVLAFAVAGRLKTLHHISTLGILPHGACGEHDFPSAHQVPARGYDRTKWVAEALVRAAGQCGLPTAVYRLGDVMPHSGRGVFSHGGSLAEFVAGACVELAVRVETGASSDFTPVDAVCRFVAAAVAHGETGGCFHVVQPQPTRLDDLLDCLEEAFGLQPVSYPEFVARLSERAEHQGSGASLRLAAILADAAAGTGSAGPFASHFARNADPGFRTRCSELSRRLNIPWVPVGTKVLHNYARSFRGDRG